MTNPISVDRYIKLSTKDELDIDTVKKWYHCVSKYAPSGTLKTVSDRPKNVSLVHQNGGKHGYLVPLTRDLSDDEVDKIVRRFAKLEKDLNFDIETNETKLSAKDHPGISIDAANH